MKGKFLNQRGLYKADRIGSMRKKKKNRKREEKKKKIRCRKKWSLVK